MVGGVKTCSTDWSRSVPLNPVVIAFPFLPLAEPVTFGTWWLGPVADFDGPWAGAALERMGVKYLNSFRDAHGKPISNPALLASIDDGVTGARPEDAERAAVRKAIAFAVIDRNPVCGTTHVSGHRCTTADNADYWEQPIDVDNGSIALERAGRVTQSIYGLSIADRCFAIAATPETVVPRTPVYLDELIVAALYDILLRAPADESAERAVRVSTAISWLEKSWLHSMSIGWDDRLVFLKTGFEALTGESSTPKDMKALVRIFGSAQCQFGSEIGLEGLLRQSTEGTRTRHVKRGSCEVTDLEHWYGALADARNTIVHEGRVPDLCYEESGSPYSGHLVEVGDRVLREAIKVEIGNLGYPDAWRGPISRASLAALRHFVEPAGRGEDT